MPIYEYVCESSGHKFEKLRPISRMDDEAPCPTCDSDSKRALSVFAAFASDDSGSAGAIAGAGGGCGGCGPGGCACAMTV